jgi:hypothetical protein
MGKRHVDKKKGVKHTSELKFLAKDTAAPTTPPKLKMDQKMPMDFPF